MVAKIRQLATLSYMATNGTTIHVSVPRDLHAKAKALAAKERRTVASVVVLALDAYLDAQSLEARAARLKVNA
jgi:hypothetical protein